MPGSPDPRPVHLVLGDQLWARPPAEAAGRRLLMVEDPGLATRRAYHARKLVLVWSAMRHYADERRAEGWDIDYRIGESLDTVLAEFADITAIRPREAGIRPLLARHGVVLVDDPGWWTSPEDFGTWLARHPAPRMENYWRDLRRRTGLLMDGKQPVGGRWNYDDENRKPFPKNHVALPKPSFAPDATTRAVMDHVRTLPGLIGTVDGFDLPTTRTDALALLADFVAHRLPWFGPYEDAMSSTDPIGYHSLLSIPLNLSLISPQECVDAAIAAWRAGTAPIASVEAFVRQIAGWREYLFHLWEQFPGDWERTNALEQERPLPAFFWTGDTSMRCLSIALRRVLETGYGHHIERLMVIGNFALMAGVRPQEVNAWFHQCYVDAYEWVVTPNVVGMSQYADGGWVARKPYVASGAYIDRMSDHCKGCAHDPKTDCPFTVLYWSFLIDREHDPRLREPLMRNLFGLARKDADERARWIAARARLLPTWNP